MMKFLAGIHPLFKRVALSLLLFLMITPINLRASKLVEARVLDKDYLIIHFKDGEVFRRDDGTGNCAFMGHCHNADGSTAVYYLPALETRESTTPGNWTLRSTDDKRYGKKGQKPVAVYRKTKLNGMSISHWDDSIRDYAYDHTLEHFIYLKLPASLEQGKSYTLEINDKTKSDTRTVQFTFDIHQNISEAIHVNLVGYSPWMKRHAADLYHWMGDGGPRNYEELQGRNVYWYNTSTREKQKAGSVKLGTPSSTEMGGSNLTGSNVWHIDFDCPAKPGTYRLIVDGVGCSQDFEISEDIYREPFRVTTLGYFYMRLGQDSPDMNPRPREPLFIPGVDTTRVIISKLHPYHPDWEGIRVRVTDPWDHPREFEPYTTGRENPRAYGGHSDAYDWDKRLPHVSIIYDMLLPYILTGGVLADDNLGIAESGNGIPDLLDEARNEVDSWLRMRDGQGYAHGRTCPYSEQNKVLFQGGTTAVAAWANALNCAMMAEAFRLSGHTLLMQEYLDSSIVAFRFASNLDDPMLDKTEGDGLHQVRGRDFKMMAAAYLYNLTGDTSWEDIMNEECVLNTPGERITRDRAHNQLWGVAAYLTTRRPVNYPGLHQQMRSALIEEAKELEANYSTTRPSRRSTDNETGYFWTIQQVQRTIIAHAVSTEPADKEFFLRALVLEADWSLGRNPANIVQMTTASTGLASKRSVQFAYTSGYNDGTPGLHPGHTPYWNMNDWAPAMIMGRPSWLASKGYPVKQEWPVAELFFNTDYVWSHTEFTPQQTLRGKNALYGYLYAIGLGPQK